MGKFDGILILSDMDNTLTCDGALSDENDITLVQMADIGYAAKNSTPSAFGSCRPYSL